MPGSFRRCCGLQQSVTDPCAIRYPRGSAYQGLEEFHAPWRWAGVKSQVKGKKDTAVICGAVWCRWEKRICSLLREKGQNPTLVNARFVKPMDTKLLKELAREHSLFVTVEENVKNGGFGEHVASYMEACHPGVQVLPVAIRRPFCRAMGQWRVCGQRPDFPLPAFLKP